MSKLTRSEVEGGILCVDDCRCRSCRVARALLAAWDALEIAASYVTALPTLIDGDAEIIAAALPAPEPEAEP